MSSSQSRAQLRDFSELLIDLFRRCSSYHVKGDICEFFFDCRGECRPLFRGRSSLDMLRELADELSFPYCLQSTILNEYVLTFSSRSVSRLFLRLIEQLRMSDYVEKTKKEP